MSNLTHSPARALLPAVLALALFAGAAHAQTPLLEVEKSDQTKLFQVNNDGGFLVRGDHSTSSTLGTIPAPGFGVRLMWFPGRAALRAGRVINTNWDLANLGQYSVAFGHDTRASGDASTALGTSTTASGQYSVAMGHNSVASGEAATAIGAATASGQLSFAGGSASEASGSHAFAYGSNVTAGGFGSVALGRFASTNGLNGSFVFGDFSSTNAVTATAANQFVVRAAGGIRLRGWHDLSHGCDISIGNLTCTGTVTGSSDVALKEQFEAVDAEEVLQKLSGLSIQRWSYKIDGPDVRHVGPTAQDFHAAFGLGQDDKTISMVDADGINMLAIQALERRTRELREKTERIESLEQRLAELEAQNAALARRLERLEAALPR